VLTAGHGLAGVAGQRRHPDPIQRVGQIGGLVELEPDSLQVGLARSPVGSAPQIPEFPAGSPVARRLSVRREPHRVRPSWGLGTRNGFSSCMARMASKSRV
jgi:hypothetical protein